MFETGFFAVLVIALLLLLAAIWLLATGTGFRRKPYPVTGIPLQSEPTVDVATVPKSTYDELQGELGATNERVGQLVVQHAADLREMQLKVSNEMIEYRSRLNLEFAEKKRSEAKATAARSRTALVAKIGEHFAPLLAGYPYNFKDSRHVGEIFDFLVFDGLEEGEIHEIVFLEVKSRKSGRVSNPRERMLRDAIEAGRVKYEVFVPDIEGAKRDADSPSEDEEPGGASASVDRKQPTRTKAVRRTPDRPAVTE